jgi:hypothetical protein
MVFLVKSVYDSRFRYPSAGMRRASLSRQIIQSAVKELRKALDIELKLHVERCATSSEFACEQRRSPINQITRTSSAERCVTTRRD